MSTNEFLQHQSAAERIQTAIISLPDDDLLCLVDLHRWEHKRVAAFPELPHGGYTQIRVCKHCKREENC